MVNLFWLTKPQIIRNATKGVEFNYQSCVQQHFDSHVIKIALEATQLLYNSHHSDPSNPEWKLQAPETKSGSRGFKPFNLNNPLSKWIRKNIIHYRHSVSYGLALCHEYTHRYGKIHSCQPHLEWLKNNEPALSSEVSTLTSPPCAMPDTYKPEYMIIQQQKEKDEHEKLKKAAKAAQNIAKRKASEVVQAISKRRKRNIQSEAVTTTVVTTASTSLSSSNTEVPAGSLEIADDSTKSLKSETDWSSIPDETFYFSEDVYKAYRDYYVGEKLTVKMVRWTKRTVPDWIVEHANKKGIKLKDLMTEEELEEEEEARKKEKEDKKKIKTKSKSVKKVKVEKKSGKKSKSS